MRILTLNEKLFWWHVNLRYCKPQVQVITRKIKKRGILSGHGNMLQHPLTENCFVCLWIHRQEYTLNIKRCLFILLLHANTVKSLHHSVTQETWYRLPILSCFFWGSEQRKICIEVKQLKYCQCDVSTSTFLESGGNLWAYKSVHARLLGEKSVAMGRI